MLGDRELDVSINRSASPDAVPRLFGSGSDSLSVSSRGLGRPTRSVSRGRMSSRGGRGSKSLGTLTSVSSSPTTVDREDMLAPLVSMIGKKLDRLIAEQTAKRAGYESVSASVTAEVEIEKLKSHERVLRMQFERDREKEAHQIRLLQMQMQYTARNPGRSGQSDLFDPGLLNAESSHRPPAQNDFFGIDMHGLLPMRRDLPSDIFGVGASGVGTSSVGASGVGPSSVGPSDTGLST